MVRERLDLLRAEYAFFNQREFMQYAIHFEIAGAGIDGELRLGSVSYPLADFRAVYTRLMDERRLPEVKKRRPKSRVTLRCMGVHETLSRWIDVSPALVVNRTDAMESNSSKPFQAQLIRRHGFLIPETLITTSPDLVRDFQARHRCVVYKSISGVRSIVRILEKRDLRRLDRIRWCPTQFQAYVTGTEIRVHVVGERVHATAIRSEASDYRYATRLCGKPAELREVRLSDELSERCVRLTKALGLVFAGIDLKVTADDRVYCFEVNTMPGFSYYEAQAGQAISESLALCLHQADRR